VRGPCRVWRGETLTKPGLAGMESDADTRIPACPTKKVPETECFVPHQLRAFGSLC